MKTTKVISFFNIKGGIGKTTTTLLTAYQLASSNPNLKILLIDADLQANLTQFIYKTSHEDKTLLDVVNNNLSADELIIKSPNSKYENIVNSEYVLKLFDENEKIAISKFIEFNKEIVKIKDSEKYLEYEIRKSLKDEEAVYFINKQLKIKNISNIKNYEKKIRNLLVKEITKIKGINTKQISRILGISSRIIERIKMDK